VADINFGCFVVIDDGKTDARAIGYKGTVFLDDSITIISTKTFVKVMI
jgi:hypothetical protein